MSVYFTVEVNGKPYMTHIDDNGVQRFVENTVIRKIVDEMRGSDDRWRAAGKPRGLQPYDLNRIAYDSMSGMFELNDQIQFHVLMGYSVSGMCDLSFMEGVEVKNPLWDFAEQERGNRSSDD